MECLRLRLSLSNAYIVGNKVKGHISKRMFQGNKARQIPRKTCVLWRLKTSVLTFALLPYYRQHLITAGGET